MNGLKQLIKNIEQWAEDRNLIEGSTPQKQFIKLMEEFDLVSFAPVCLKIKWTW
ncbi:Uncharacterised protein [Haemophilus influenzae]|uniref:hypothetical protein n=1 Tax=Haemophilus influenzae TaxID=727 RepID=UPI000DA2C4FE|nr:hypothetical protein [Haemophilus influenzae]SQK93957.1 Uncharacterised protein [Haemophilus influenzae]